MNLLAIDFGTKNIGLAKASTEVDVVLPFGVISNVDKNQAEQELVKLIKDQRVDKIIVGLPFGLDGKENNNTIRIREFVERLKKEVDVSFEFITEVFSSQAGDRMGVGVSRDEKSAMVILQSYLEKTALGGKQ